MDTNETINFRKLEKEFHQAKAADEKYSRENDAKFRAVHQKVASYDEFKDIVAASGLKPLDHKDIYNNDKIQQPWNTLYNNQTETEKTKTTGDKKLYSDSTIDQIKSSNDFIKAWKTARTDELKLNVLLSVSIKSKRIFQHDIPMNVFEESIRIFKCYLNEENSHHIVDILDGFTCSQRFSLSLKFLGKVDRKNLEDLLVTLQQYNIEINELKKLYLS